MPDITFLTAEEQDRSLAHGLILCTQSEAEYLMHFGIKGQKHGIRRWQNEDGSLTPEGYIHYGVGQGNKAKAKADKYQAKADKIQLKADKYKVKADKYAKRAEKQEERGKAEIEKDKETYNKDLKDYKDQELDSRIEKYDSLSKEDRTSLRKEVNDQLNGFYEKAATNTLTNEERNRMRALSDFAYKADIKEASDKYSQADNDEKKESFLKDAFFGGQTSSEYLFMRHQIIENSGDIMTGHSKTEANKQAAEEYESAQDEYWSAWNRIQDQAKKEHPLSYKNQRQRQSELKAEDRPYQEAKQKLDTSFEKYCATVLKDLGLPVNEKTLEYIESVIMYD